MNIFTTFLKGRNCFLILLSIFILLFANFFSVEAQHRGIRGQKAPELKIKSWINALGKPTQPIKLKNYTGKIVYLFCFQSWCPGCHKYGFPTLKKISHAFKGNKDIVFLAVQTVFEGASINTKDKIRALQKRYDLEMPIGHDAGSTQTENISSLMRDYRTGGTPWVIIIDKRGYVIFNDFHVHPKNTIKALKKLANDSL